MQTVQIIGRLGRDPETRYLDSGTAVTNFSVAVGEQWKDRNTGEKRERTTWFNCEAWGRLGEIVSEYLHKGAQCYVRGKMVNEEWNDRESGEKRQRMKLRCDEVEFLQTNRSGGGGQSRGPADGKLPGNEQPSDNEDDFDDDIPF